VEVALYYLAIATVILAGILVGRRACSTFQAVLLGVMGNLLTVALLFCTTILLAVLSPGLLDPDDMGFRLGVLMLFGPAVGMVAAIGSRRHAVRARARLF
jgi:hypothetical protein